MASSGAFSDSQVLQVDLIGLHQAHEHLTALLPMAWDSCNMDVGRKCRLLTSAAATSCESTPFNR